MTSGAVEWAERELPRLVRGVGDPVPLGWGDGSTGALRRAVLRSAILALGGKGAVYDWITEAQRQRTVTTETASWVFREVERAFRVA